MKFLILALALLCSSAVAYKKEIVELNRVMSGDVTGSPCEACQIYLKVVAQRATNPLAIEKLKNELMNECTPTSSADVCRVFVSKFIDQALSYLNDPHAFCVYFHVCENKKKKINAFRHLLTDYFKHAEVSAEV
uniref:Saposin B-type domain-containing protein n=1 Tax=Caenorhabditis japonica TaxID=281687 RepID=A0A8R1HQF7_CAEJA